jgi:glutamyl/glutaminyl-tRNA synthetase
MQGAMNLSDLPADRVTRFAPSLTGYLHLGNVLHMIYVWGIAKAHPARIICRMEDHDFSRNRPEYEPAILSDMQWLGFVPDEGLSNHDAPSHSSYRQSDCSAAYEKRLLELQAENRVYGCSCSRREILKRQPDGLEELCYSGTCADKNLPLEGHTVRFRVLDNSVVFQDLALGEFCQEPRAQCGDFSLRDRTGQWTYQFCCVVDDIRHGVNLVIRGADILGSTGRQLQLFDALGHPHPAYYHHPLALNEEGKKLSKRLRSETLTQLRESGVTAEDVLGRAAFAGGLISQERPVSMPEIISLFE